VTGVHVGCESATDAYEVNAVMMIEIVIFSGDDGAAHVRRDLCKRYRSTISVRINSSNVFIVAIIYRDTLSDCVNIRQCRIRYTEKNFEYGAGEKPSYYDAKERDNKYLDSIVLSRVRLGGVWVVDWFALDRHVNSSAYII
jgi:hypothetical protein